MTASEIVTELKCLIDALELELKKKRLKTPIFTLNWMRSLTTTPNLEALLTPRRGTFGS